MAARTKSAKDRPSYRCTECGWTTAKWLGRCPECQAWGTVEEYGGARRCGRPRPGRVTTAGPPDRPGRRPAGHRPLHRRAASWTGCSAAAWCPAPWCCWPASPASASPRCCWTSRPRRPSDEHRTLYVTGEESASQVRLRADRIGAIDDHLYLAAETDLSAVLGHLDAVKPSLLVLDSVQTVASPEIDGAPGGMAQVREVAGRADPGLQGARHVHAAGRPCHQGRRDRGPRLLEHLVDVVLHFEGDRHARLRLVRGVKNRYGATDEVGCFELHDEGITGLADPSGLFLTRRDEPVPGTCLTVTLEGRRPLVAEVQALTVDTQIPSPRRTTSGLETSRVSMMLAVLEQRGRISALGKRDIYTRDGRRGEALRARRRPGGRARAGRPRRATPRCRRTWWRSAKWAWPARSAGSPACSARLSEAHRLGFTHALVPTDPGKIPAGMKVIEVADMGDALRVLPRRSSAQRRPRDE